MNSVYLPVASSLVLTWGILVPASEWRQHSLGYIEVETCFAVDGPIENFGTSVITVPANSGTSIKTQEVLGAPTQNPPTWDPRFTPLKTPAQNVQNPWSHDVVYLEPAFGWVHRSCWMKSQGWQQFERYDDDEPTGIMLRRDRDWFEPHGEEEVIYPLDTGGGGGGGS